MERLTSMEASARLIGDEGLVPDDLVLHEVGKLEAVRRGDLTLHTRESCAALVGHGFRVYLWRDAWCVTGDVREIEDLDRFCQIARDILRLQEFLEARSAA